VVPGVEFIVRKLQSFAAHLDPAQIWVNPDCGLKTRAWDEVLPSLRHIAVAVASARREFSPDETAGSAS
jgi:5-methyltetrahydropteroyltriglutamate--homocysteine methyltransferase